MYYKRNVSATLHIFRTNFNDTFIRRIVSFFYFYRSTIRWISASRTTKRYRKGNRSGNHCLGRDKMHHSSLRFSLPFPPFAARKFWRLFQPTFTPHYLCYRMQSAGRNEGGCKGKTGRFFGVLVIRDTAYISLPLSRVRRSTFFPRIIYIGILINSRLSVSLLRNLPLLACEAITRFLSRDPNEISCLCYARGSPLRRPEDKYPAIHIHVRNCVCIMLGICNTVHHV